ncbi:MAG: histidine kinase, partial [Acidobacteriota bacterium]
GMPNVAELLNIVGFVTGAALCAMLLSLVLRARAFADRGDTVPIFMAGLGLVWNLGELGDYLLNRAGFSGPESWLSALSFAALAGLAAVVVHSVARDVRRGWVVIATAYALSAAATVMQVRTLASGDARPSALAFTTLTVAFGAIALPLALLTRRQTNGRRALWMLALALFAVAANHLGHFHNTTGGWSAELVGHHAVLPLAFAILYQEYRFALADLFLKRALTLLSVVAVALACIAVLARLPAGPVPEAALLACWVLTAMLYPTLQLRISHFVDSALLGRQDYTELRAGFGASLEECETAEAVLDRLASAVATAMDARRVWWRGQGDAGPADMLVTTEIAVPTTEAPHFSLCIGELVGGRHLLSDDRAFLEIAAVAAARRLDAMRLAVERIDQRLREEEMERLAAEAELRALRAQINPHFLFNALTTIGYLIQTAPPRALKTLLRLTSLLRSVLRSEGEMTTLGRELDLVEHYLDIERERFEERLRVHLDVPPALRALSVPCLIVQPLVENAVKHGVAPAVQGGEVRVTARLHAADGRQTLVVSVTNTGAPLTSDRGVHDSRVGLRNVARRLAGYFGDRAALSLSAAGGETTAEVRLPVVAAAATGDGDRFRRAIG